MTTIKTKITELLDRFDIPYRLLPHTEPVFTIEAAAAQRGVVKQEMVKSILLREKKLSRYVMACVPGQARLDPKAVRAHLPQDWKRLSFASGDEILQVTGYPKGAVAPLCLPAEIPVLFDQSFTRCTKVNISSGDPMAGLELRLQDLIKLARGRLAPIAEVAVG